MLESHTVTQQYKIWFIEVWSHNSPRLLVVVLELTFVAYDDNSKYKRPSPFYKPPSHPFVLSDKQQQQFLNPSNTNQWLPSTAARNVGQTSIWAHPTSTHQTFTSRPGTKAHFPSHGSTRPSSGSRKRTRSDPFSRLSTTGAFRGKGPRSFAIAVAVLLVTCTMMVLLWLTVLVSFTWDLARSFLELPGIGSRPRRFRSHPKTWNWSWVFVFLRFWVCVCVFFFS